MRGITEFLFRSALFSLSFAQVQKLSLFLNVTGFQLTCNSQGEVYFRWFWPWMEMSRPCTHHPAGSYTLFPTPAWISMICPLVQSLLWPLRSACIRAPMVGRNFLQMPIAPALWLLTFLWAVDTGFLMVMFLPQVLSVPWPRLNSICSAS